jgi:amidase
MKRRQFIRFGAGTAGAAPAWRAGAARPDMDVPIEEATINQLGAALRTRQTTAVQLLQRYTERIAQLDRAGPRLRSVIELNPEAEAVAAQRDAEASAGRWRGPLHGLPVIVKDNLATADAMHTSAGSLALVGAKAPRDAFVVQRLREAGAVLIGKANLSEWANIRGTHSISGWSARGGQTRCPYALDRSPSGSSSGTGAAVAANLCAAGIGTETDGSITSPSSVNALVGIKPTVGLVSRDGIVPISFTQDTAGPMCRTVRDAALVLAAIGGIDARDAATQAQRGRIDLAALVPEVPAPDAARPLRGLRIGIAENLVGDHRGVAALFDSAQAALSSLGATLVAAPIPNTDRYAQSELDVLLFELRHAMAGYLREFAPNLPHRDLADLIAYNEAHAPEELALFGQEYFVQAQAKGPLTHPAYAKALALGRRFARTHGIDAALRKHRLQALIAPTTGPAWLIDPVNGDAGSASATSPPAVAGYPHVTVPMGQVQGLPVGLSVIGTAWSEPSLLRIAFAYEQATRWRKPPAYRERST